MFKFYIKAQNRLLDAANGDVKALETAAHMNIKLLT